MRRARSDPDSDPDPDIEIDSDQPAKAIQSSVAGNHRQRL